MDRVSRSAYTRRNRRESGLLSEKSGSTIFVGQYDFTILLTVIILVLFGIIMIFSASYYSASNSSSINDMYYFLKRQLLWAVIGFCAMSLMSTINYRHFRKFTLPIYLLSIFFLILVLFIGKEIGGAKRWIEIPGIGGFQPSEFAKIALILFLSNYIYSNKDILNRLSGFIACAVIVSVPTVLIAIENMSTALVTALIGFAIIFIASPKIWYFIVVALGGTAGVAYMLTANFRVGRIVAWRDPFADPMNTGYQILQALYAIGSGGLFGLGLGNSRQKLGYIPEGHNDIIFAIICEELGFFGAAILIFLFMILIWRGITTAINATDLLGCLIATGTTVLVAVQVIINVAVVTNTIPNTGIPLPFISYGGSSLSFLMFMIGVLLNISRYSREK